jgi:hypothetical protein
MGERNMFQFLFWHCVPNALQNCAELNPMVQTIKKFLNLGRQHHEIFGKKGSKILKTIPPVRNCFTLAMADKLVVIINKVSKIKKILVYEMKFLVRNYSCLQNPWLGGGGVTAPLQIPVLSVLCLQLNFLCSPPPPPQDQNSWSSHCDEIHFNRNWVDTLWQQYSKHLHTNSTQNDTM